MKRIISLLVLATCAIQALMAQDIIVTRQSERIDAKVTEVTENEVRYKKTSNPDGPVFVLSRSSIVSIIYANGEVQLFNDTNEEQKRSSSAISQPRLQHGDRKPDPNMTLYRIRDKIVVQKELNPAHSTLIYEPNNLRTLLGEAEYENYQSAQKTYKRGSTMVTFGWIDAAAGLLTTILGAKDNSSGAVAIGLILCGAADILIPVGYIVQGVNAGRISRIAEAHNRDARLQYGMAIGMSPAILPTGDGIAPGIGLALHF